MASYGLITSKSGSIMVEPAAVAVAHGRPTRSQEQLQRFLDAVGHRWVTGRVSLTKLRFTFLPQEQGRGAVRLEIDLAEITAVEITGGRVNKVVTVRCGSHVVFLRLVTAAKFAEQVAQLASEARAAKGSPG